MKPAVSVVTLFLSIVAVLHLLRLVFQLPITIGSTEIPMWASVVAVIVTGLLAAWLWRDQRN